MVKRALEILTDDPDRQIPFLTGIWSVSMASALGFCCNIAINFGTRRPLFSGIQYHFLGAAVGGAFGYWADKYNIAQHAERDAVLRYYVETHPEDFPDPDRKKFGDLFLPWTPIR